MLHKKKGFIYINDKPVQYPDKDSGLQTISTIVDSARTVDGVMRGERVGRDVNKIEMSWNVLTPEDWKGLLKLLQKFIVTVRYFDMVRDDWVVKKFYCSDRSARPYLVNTSTGRPTHYVNCSVNLIDIGE